MDEPLSEFYFTTIYLKICPEGYPKVTFFQADLDFASGTAGKTKF